MGPLRGEESEQSVCLGTASPEGLGAGARQLLAAFPFRETFSAASETGVGYFPRPRPGLCPPRPGARGRGLSLGRERRPEARPGAAASRAVAPGPGAGAGLGCARFNVTSFVPPYFLLENVFTWRPTGPSSAEALPMAPYL